MARPETASQIELDHPSPLSGTDLALRAIESALEQKARDVTGLDLSSLSDVSDFFVIASGTSNRHVRGIADRIKNDLKELNETPLSVVGEATGEWILLDYGNVVVHVFFEPIRVFYNIEDHWQAAPRLTLPDDLQRAAEKLRTGLV